MALSSPSNVLLDLFAEDPTWSSWSAARLAEAPDRGPVVINQVVYGEVSLRFATVEALDEVLTPDRFVRANLPWAAAFLAARSHRAYRAAGGVRTGTLPDVLIGARAAVLGLALAHFARRHSMRRQVPSRTPITDWDDDPAWWVREQRRSDDRRAG